MQYKLFIIVSCLVMAVGCGSGSAVNITGDESIGTDVDNSAGETGTGETETLQSLITKFSGATFVSVETLEVGSTPTGVAMGNWLISFTDDVVTWTYSDVVETGTYTLTESGDPVASFSGREIAFSGDGISLDWDSRTYRRLHAPLFDSQQSLVEYFDATTYKSADERDIGEGIDGGLVMGYWTIGFNANETQWWVQDTVQVGTYSFVDGASFNVTFGSTQQRVYVLEGDQLLANAVIYKKDSTGQFDSQDSLVAYLTGTSYQSTTLQQVGPVANGTVALGSWFLNFSEDTFVWSYADVEVAGTVEYLSENTFSAVFTDRTLTIEIDGADILWDGLRYARL